MITAKDLVARNREYSKTHIPPLTREQAIAAAGGKRPPIPIIIGCIDARIIPEFFLGLKVGEATVFRNAGGRVNNNMILQIASLGVLRPIGDILIVHHVGCGTTYFTNEGMKKDLHEKWGSDSRIDDMEFGAISDLPQSIRDDVKRLQDSPFISKDTIITGFVYDIQTGLLEQID